MAVRAYRVSASAAAPFKTETALRRCCPSPCAGQMGFHASVVFPGVPLLAPACRLPPLLPLGIPRECAAPLSHAHNQSPPCRGRQVLGGNLRARNFPTPLQYHRFVLSMVSCRSRHYFSKLNGRELRLTDPNTCLLTTI